MMMFFTLFVLIVLQ